MCAKVPFFSPLPFKKSVHATGDGSTFPEKKNKKKRFRSPQTVLETPSEHEAPADNVGEGSQSSRSW